MDSDTNVGTQIFISFFCKGISFFLKNKLNEEYFLVYYRVLFFCFNYLSFSNSSMVLFRSVICSSRQTNSFSLFKRKNVGILSTR